MLATLRRVAPAQTLPRGESGLEAGDGSVAQTCSSVLPRRSLDRFRRGFVFSEKEYWDQLPSLSSESKREASHGAFFAPGLPYGFLAGSPVLPTQQSILSRPRAIAPHAVSLQSEKHSGDYRENEAGMDCEPLHRNANCSQLFQLIAPSDHMSTREKLIAEADYSSASALVRTRDGRTGSAWRTAMGKSTGAGYWPRASCTPRTSSVNVLGFRYCSDGKR